MIKRLTIDGFKSLVDFTVEFSKFNCLIGLNGSGKSTLLQAVDFLSHVMSGQVREWLSAREWEAEDIRSYGGTKPTLHFELELDLPTSGKVIWSGIFDQKSLCCLTEIVTRAWPAVPLLWVRDDSYEVVDIGTNETVSNEIEFRYEGSILSQLKESALGKDKEVLLELKAFIVAIRSLDLLSPHLLRQRAREATDIGIGGEKLSAFLYALPQEKRQILQSDLERFYPQLRAVYIQSLPSGWKDLKIEESHTKALMGRRVVTQARHINDGMLRLMAILAEMLSGHGVLLFDEIENGINPELIQKLVSHFLNAGQQIIVTTHSPMILNYIPDEEAKEGVILLYKTDAGFTQAVKFFELSGPKEKLGCMGPGEAFVDTSLEDAALEAAEGKGEELMS